MKILHALFVCGVLLIGLTACGASGGSGGSSGGSSGGGPTPVSCTTNPTQIQCDTDGDGYNYGSDPDDTDPCRPSATGDDCDFDGDGTRNADDPDISDPCQPSNAVSACDSDGDGMPDGSDSAPNDPCSPAQTGPTCDPDNDGVVNRDDPQDNNPCLPDYSQSGCAGPPAATYNPLGRETFVSASGAAFAHVYNFTGQGVIVGVIDSAVDTDHPAFDGTRITQVYDSFPNDPCYATPLNCSGYSHGTHVAGIIGANATNGVVVGMAPDVEIKSASIFDRDGNPGTGNDIYNAIRAVVDGGAVAINNSWGFPADEADTLSPGNSVLTALDYAINNDTILVWAMGNNYGDTDSSGNQVEGNLYGMLPLHYDRYKDYWVTVVNVSETSPGNGVWEPANGVGDGDASNGTPPNVSANVCGPTAEFCLVAPGTLIYSTVDPGDSANGGNEYGYMSGSSMAAPVVTGAIALIKQYYPELSGPEILRLLFRTATDLGAVGVDEIYGQGMLNVEEAMAFQGDPTIATSSNVSAGLVSLTATSAQAPASLTGRLVSQTKDMVVLDQYTRAFTLQSSSNVQTVTLATRDPNYGARFSWGAANSSAPGYELAGGTLGELGVSQHLSDSFGNALFGQAHFGRVSVTAAADENLSFGTTLGYQFDERLRAEIGAFRNNNIGDLYTLSSSGAFAFADGYTGFFGRAGLSDTWGAGRRYTFDIEAELGASLIDSAVNSLFTDHSMFATAALDASVGMRNALMSGDHLRLGVKLPTWIAYGTATINVPVDREVDGVVVRQENSFNFAVDPTILGTIRYDLSHNFGVHYAFDFQGTHEFGLVYRF